VRSGWFVTTGVPLAADIDRWQRTPSSASQLVGDRAELGSRSSGSPIAAAVMSAITGPGRARRCRALAPSAAPLKTHSLCFRFTCRELAENFMKPSSCRVAVTVVVIVGAQPTLTVERCVGERRERKPIARRSIDEFDDVIVLHAGQMKAHDEASNSSRTRCASRIRALPAPLGLVVIQDHAQLRRRSWDDRVNPEPRLIFRRPNGVQDVGMDQRSNDPDGPRSLRRATTP
jgi:hypothetical protein